ncbi:hypothetical protein HDU98_009107 [Podochytrium sp. JEL0797]|nr:hypothetical protein HDU98_009107 [Podochytrium sp. JEL0797]
MRFGWLLVHLVAAVHSQANFCAPSNTFCASITANDASQSYSVTVQTTLQGWAGIGLSATSMPGTKMVVGWLNSTTAPVVSVRHAGGFSMPVSIADANIAAIPVNPAPLLAGVAFAFSVPYAKAADYFGVPAGTAGNFIYATANAGPTDPDSASSGFGYHDYRGLFTLVIPAQGVVQGVQTSNVSSAVTANATATTSNKAASQTSSLASPTALADGGVAGMAVSTFCSDTVGRGMTNANIFTCWLDSNNQPIITQRDGVAYTQPALSPIQQFTTTTTPTSITIASTSKIIFSLILPISLFNANTTTPFIYALSSSPPSTPDSPSSSFPMHSTREAFSLDVSKLGTTTTGQLSATSPNFLFYHGICMFLAWCILPPIGIFIARYLKQRLGHLWYKLHVAIMFGGIASLMALGLLFVELHIPEDTPRFSGSTPHGVIGMLIAFGLYPLQVVLGYTANALFNAERTHVPWWDKMHWIMGRLAGVLALINILFGLILYGAEVGVIGAYGAVVVAIGVGFGLTEWRMGGAVHHVQMPSSP